MERIVIFFEVLDPWVRLMNNRLSGLARLRWANNIPELEQFLLNGPRPTLVVLTGGSGARDLVGVLGVIDNLVAAGYTDLVAADPTGLVNDQLMAAGCRHRVDDRDRLAPFIEQYLNGHTTYVD
ncbi:MAG: hypothetical protein HY975_02910 [Candidatus Kerfeldbacteria bacterium]|nr:hypothetical protein [Candidatus Kerfeldbacteria bacterium]